MTLFQVLFACGLLAAMTVAQSSTWMLNPAHPVVGNLQAGDYEVIRPSHQESDSSEDSLHQLPSSRPQALKSSQKLSPPTGHPDQLSFNLKAFGKEFQIELRKNTDLFSDNYHSTQMAWDEKTQAFVEQKREATPEAADTHCYYHGYVRGDPKSDVAMSTCDGLRGVIRAFDEWFAVDPSSPLPIVPTGDNKLALTEAMNEEAILFSSTSSTSDSSVRAVQDMVSMDHLVYKLSNVAAQTKGQCGVPTPSTGSSDSSKKTEDHTPEDILRAVPHAATPAEPRTEALAGRPPKYIEVLVYNDNARYRRFGATTEAQTASIMNYIAKFYSDSNFYVDFKVVLSGQRTFTSPDPFERLIVNGQIDTQGYNGLLQAFHNFLGQGAVPHFDQAMLFSGNYFRDGIVGLAGVGTMCNGVQSSAVCQMLRGSDPLNALVCGHEMGHNLGMEHDSQGNSCGTSGYIMAPYAGSATTFSSCSVQYAASFMNSGATCMDNNPVSGLHTEGDDEGEAEPTPQPQQDTPSDAGSSSSFKTWFMAGCITVGSVLLLISTAIIVQRCKAAHDHVAELIPQASAPPAEPIVPLAVAIRNPAAQVQAAVELAPVPQTSSERQQEALPCV